MAGSTHRRGSRTGKGARELRNINLARPRRTATDSSNAALAGASLATAPAAPPRGDSRQRRLLHCRAPVHPSADRGSLPYRTSGSRPLYLRSALPPLACLRAAGDDRLACQDVLLRAICRASSISMWSMR